MPPEARLDERVVQAVDEQGDVVVAGAELVGVDARVPGQLEPVAVARHAHEHVDRAVRQVHPPPLLEAELLVEVDGAVDVADPVAGVEELGSQQVRAAMSHVARQRRTAASGQMPKKIVAAAATSATSSTSGWARASASGDQPPTGLHAARRQRRAARPRSGPSTSPRSRAGSRRARSSSRPRSRSRARRSRRPPTRRSNRTCR